MQLSNNNLLKQTSISKNKSSKSIVTKAVAKPHAKKKKRSPKDAFNTSELSASQQKSMEIIRQKILGNAKEEAARIKETAYQQAKEEGYQDGYQAGELEGKKAAQELTEQAKRNLAETIDSTKQYVAAERNRIISFAIEMTEILVKHELDKNSEELLPLLDPILFKLEKPDQVITIHANPRYHEVLVKKMEAKKRETANLRYIVLDNLKLSPYEITVESTESFETFDLQEELRKFLQQIQETE
ncbi:flagellar assembly protein FliH [Liquorilactobacillus aquaticus DSM 21051]|uniref:Flagellar assembly protein FliH n=2 Tax=Liquorilactobacillus aquaticus TaxID=392566 RepID=A0A0R2CZJ1_9LACO|nr:FliH/SctL family protein [Liquorilactobacillus aquaticus]AJA33769.1 flagellar assembly protein FliH [Liquorilactobacillus aquaticus]KRM96869.1 flagellar assembly protein FliH [Liquorilactobacillus aquaticus DSM 21051]